MQITSITNNQNHKSQNQTFTGIKQVKCAGLYNKYPELGKELVDTFKNNAKAMEFCKKYDVSIIFHAVKENLDSAKASICIFYDNIAKSKFKKFLDSLNNSEDKVVIYSWGNKYNINESLLEATEGLKGAISKENPTAKYPTGLLDAHLDIADRKIQKAITRKNEAKQKKLDKIMKDKNTTLMRNTNKNNLETSIKDLIEESK